MPERLGLEAARIAVAAGELGAADLNAALRDRIAALDRRLNCYVHLEPSPEMDHLNDSSLMGLPYTLKDNMNLRGTPTTCASRLLDGYVSPYDCGVGELLAAAGGAYLGKTNMDEFAMGSSGEYSARGATRNPWDLERSPGGSSSGSAAAVAADLALFALGSDTGGSIRQPAAFCGVVGVKPSYGRVSRRGLVAFASSLDQIGPITKCVADAARVLELIMGPDPGDASTVASAPPPLGPELERGVAGLRVGLPAGLAELGLDAAVATAWAEAARALTEAGAQTLDVQLPHLPYAVSAYALLANAEASSNLARYDGLRYGRRDEVAGDLAATITRSRSEGFGPEVKRRILLGTFALSAGYYEDFYLKAQQLRTLLRADFSAAFAHCDCILLPTAPTPAFRLGEKLDDPLAMYLSDVFTLPASLCGLPAASVPTALAGSLPLGMQLVAPYLDEPTLFRAAAALERAFPFGALRRRHVDRVLGEAGS